ncbi:MAG: amidase [Gemmataceae bacterium]
MNIEQSGAFVEVFTVEPTAAGPLDGLTFVVKDLLDVAGRRTGYGNPTWRDTHPPAAAHAVCVEQLLAAGARCGGKTITDELAFSLVGENHFYGTPLNPKAPQRVPGGSSSGSASAVACGLADFALGSDTGGSVRVPASNCGLFGLRPSHGHISLAGVLPLSPSFDTVGLFARTAEVLARVAGVLLGCDVPASCDIGTVYLLTDAFALCDESSRQALQAPVASLQQQFPGKVRETPFAAIVADPAGSDLYYWYQEVFRIVQWSEIWSCLGSWITATRPELGPIVAKSFQSIQGIDRRRLGEAVRRRERYCRQLAHFLQPNDILCLPTAPTPAPLKGTVGDREQTATNYYPRALALTTIAGLGRLPQVSLPLAECDGAPLGLSFIAGHGQDALLLSMAKALTP